MRPVSEVEPRFKDMSAPKPKRRKPIPYKSPKRMSDGDKRAAVRAAVLERAGGDCEYAGVIPEVRCASPDPRRPAIEVDEIRGGAYRCTEWLNPDRCMASCQSHHDFKTLNKREVLLRLGEDIG
jgi:hypothetical protein